MSRVADQPMFVNFETVADRPGRIFARSEEQMHAGRLAMQEEYTAPEVLGRLRSIENVCKRPEISATAHRDTGGRYHLFINNPDVEGLPNRLFACVVRSETEAFAGVDVRGFHVESLDEIFVGKSLELDHKALERILRTWLMRCYSGVDPDSVVVEIFSGTATS